ncbi:MAG TPA: hypothetical protein VL088_07350 [Pedobacter sp.]|nr:hypothetical protein [Pedobacter sp.]
MELRFSEQAFIFIMRNFDFLRQCGYRIKELILYGREPYVIFYNERYKRKITIEWAPQSEVHIYISNTTLLNFSKSQIIIDNFAKSVGYQLIQSLKLEEVIENKALFIKSHLMLVIKGDEWLG